MKETTSKALAAVIIGGLSAYMGQLIIPLIMLVGVVIVDIISGILKAWVRNEVWSKTCYKGIIKKLSYLLLICVAGVVDWLIYAGLTEVGISIEFGFCFGLIVTIWLIINELISILENLNALDVPMPNFLTRIIKHLKTAVEVKANAAETED